MQGRFLLGIGRRLYLTVQHVHIPLAIFIKPTAITIIGQTIAVVSDETTFTACRRNVRPKSTTRAGIILWCGQPHLFSVMCNFKR